MVVPSERLSVRDKFKKYVGNDLKLSIFNNRRILLITGNNCQVKLSENSGLLKVVGDNCEITVLQGDGNIEYVGNNGKIMLGSTVSEELVTYIGNEGEITSANCSSISNKGEKRDSKSNESRRPNPKENCVDINNASEKRVNASYPPNIIPIPVPNIRISRCKDPIKPKI